MQETKTCTIIVVLGGVRVKYTLELSQYSKIGSTSKPELDLAVQLQFCKNFTRSSKIYLLQLNATPFIIFTFT